MFCPYCGLQIEQCDSKFCDRCGNPLPELPPAIREVALTDEPPSVAAISRALPVRNANRGWKTYLLPISSITLLIIGCFVLYLTGWLPVMIWRMEYPNAAKLMDSKWVQVSEDVDSGLPLLHEEGLLEFSPDGRLHIGVRSTREHMRYSFYDGSKMLIDWRVDNFEWVNWKLSYHFEISDDNLTFDALGGDSAKFIRFVQLPLSHEVLTGLWISSYDSRVLGPNGGDCLDKLVGATEANTFSAVPRRLVFVGNNQLQVTDDEQKVTEWYYTIRDGSLHLEAPPRTTQVATVDCDIIVSQNRLFLGGIGPEQPGRMGYYKDDPKMSDK